MILAMGDSMGNRTPEVPKGYLVRMACFAAIQGHRKDFAPNDVAFVLRRDREVLDLPGGLCGAVHPLRADGAFIASVGARVHAEVSEAPFDGDPSSDPSPLCPI